MRLILFAIVLIAAVVLDLAGQRGPSRLVLVITLLALMDGACAAYRSERAARDQRNEGFTVTWSFPEGTLKEDWAGPYLRTIRAQVEMWLRRTRSMFASSAASCARFVAAGAGARFWPTRRRELLVNMEDWGNSSPGSWLLQPMDDPHHATAKFRNGNSAFNVGGVKVSGPIDYDLMVVASSPKGQVIAAPAAFPVSQPRGAESKQAT
jgi:hypothetical protein